MAHGYENLHLNRYLFSGKELQDANVGDLGFLGLYDYGARFYDPILGRWHNIDPALQTTNPYLFCGNAPMVYVDKDGRFFWWIVAAAAVVGAYMGGSAANNDWNLFQWDWSSWSTWGGMLGGAVQGALAGASLGYGISALTGPIFAASKFSTMGTILRFTSLGFSGIKTVATGASLITNFSDGMDIVRGNYAYSSKTFGGKWLQGLLRATWEKPQQYLGYTYAQLRNGFDPNVDVRYFHGAVVINKPGSKTNKYKGVTLGNMINGWNLDSDEDPMLLHEYGHTIQGRWFGLLYLPLIGAPSLISSWLSSVEDHSNRWYEKQANRLARKYFGEDYWDSLTNDDEYPTRNY